MPVRVAWTLVLSRLPDQPHVLFLPLVPLLIILVHIAHGIFVGRSSLNLLRMLHHSCSLHYSQRRWLSLGELQSLDWLHFTPLLPFIHWLPIADCICSRDMASRLPCR